MPYNSRHLCVVSMHLLPVPATESVQTTIMSDARGLQSCHLPSSSSPCTDLLQYWAYPPSYSEVQGTVDIAD
ncbi:uncharacterized protein BCR38DRAFT_422142 [Pseudomassariella vexata]|uniref:Uncharacterized protein n=1 Tax=Pseudomassariella vexata TaxID=1141098 RepID=A0A1Y2EGL6_9PEZI|nr:uncharacterized protein BCR38DRAFT_422142 [Pseudomassariella vexata]ORY70444.1 hypothetical protein BCR38DRAFT_422142 [Pseudomassariella vexata]